MWQFTVSATDVQEVLEVLDQKRERARVVAGATDLILELERGVRKGIDTLIDVSRIENLNQITLDEEDYIHLGPLVTHNQCVASKLLRERAFPLAQAAWEVGSPQIRNRGTIAGNLITASPANDTITPLMAMDAAVVLRSINSERTVRLADFYTGVRKNVLQPNEFLVDIVFPALKANQRGLFIKYALRRAQAISLVNTAILLRIQEGRVEDARITFGAVAPTIIHAGPAEAFLKGKALTDDVIQAAATLVDESIHPISDVRSSAGYRRSIAKTILRRGLECLRDGHERESVPEDPVLLWGKTQQHSQLGQSVSHDTNTPIVTRINGQEYVFHTGQNKTLLRLLREEGGLIGTKEGCAEGECGACTVYLDGLAVMSCMVPAARAHQAEIVTIEGLAKDGELHPVQSAFIAESAVQCGYCTPGFIMSAAKLLEEKPHPSQDEIRQAITGNLCRCTGYYTILSAIERAAEGE
ncbi:MAG: 2Fe-2S iron-sulfur cluster binding domain-containing protein [Chloroflexi bacterium]|nr:2Fe-2S iron-sulfur cluster binding domain-containing protein [Chloroflexota bacterium]